MGNYRKLIAALVGLAVLFAHRYFGWDVLGVEPMLVDFIVSALTLVGVERFRNGPAPDKSEFTGEQV